MHPISLRSMPSSHAAKRTALPLTWLVVTALVAACSAGGGGDGSDGSGAGGSSGASGSTAAESNLGGSTSNEPESTVYSEEDYEPSCDEEECTDEEICLEDDDGTHCSHACPGNVCTSATSADATIPYCTREGGVICHTE